MNNTSNKIKAFTLIELLVVIAIIGILSGVVIIALSGTQESARDARIKSGMNQLRTVMEIYKASNNGDYSGIDSDPDASLLIADIIDQGGDIDLSININPVEDAYCAISQLSSSTSTWCIDSSGFSGIGGCSSYQCDSSIGGGTPPVDPCASIAQGGEWIDSGLGFCVMKYEARKAAGDIASSNPIDPVWASINQESAREACQAIGADLITNDQWTALARNIENTASNWSNGAVGNGVLARGWAANTSYGDSWTNDAVAPSTDSSCLYNTAADSCGPTGTHLYKRTHTLSNGETIWDLSGNVYEWNSDTCSQTNWYDSDWPWIEWNNAVLSDYEKPNAGPSGAFTSSHGAGRYYGCIANDNGFLRGGSWDNGAAAGVFALLLYFGPASSYTPVGFRCTVTP